MKAYQIEPGAGIEAIRQVEMPDPTLKHGEVLIRVRATSLNHRDLNRVRNPGEPIIPLSDGAGEVVGVGEAVTEFAVGDRVIGCFFPNWEDGLPNEAYTAEALGGNGRDGMLAELVALPQSGVVHTPGYLSDVEAATIPCAMLTAWNALFEQNVARIGQTALLIGTGGVSIAALQLADAAGMRTIILSSSDEKLQRAAELGADETINYVRQPDWDTEVLKRTQGRGVDVALEVGGPGTFDRSCASVREGGTVVVIGAVSKEDASSETSRRTALPKYLNTRQILVGSRRMFMDMNRGLIHNQIRPVVDHVVGFDDTREAYRALEAAGHFGKIAIEL